MSRVIRVVPAAGVRGQPHMQPVIGSSPDAHRSECRGSSRAAADANGADEVHIGVGHGVEASPWPEQAAGANLGSELRHGEASGVRLLVGEDRSRECGKHAPTLPMPLTAPCR